MTLDYSKAVLINESREERAAGDVSLYQDIVTAEKALEAIDVENDEYFGYTLAGRKLAFSVTESRWSKIRRVHISLAEDSKDYSPLVRELLEAAASHVLGRHKRPPLEEGSPLDSLIQIVQFSK